MQLYMSPKLVQMHDIVHILQVIYIYLHAVGYEYNFTASNIQHLTWFPYARRCTLQLYLHILATKYAYSRPLISEFVHQLIQIQYHIINSSAAKPITINSALHYIKGQNRDRQVRQIFRVPEVYVTCVVLICLIYLHLPWGAACPQAHAYISGKSFLPMLHIAIK